MAHVGTRIAGVATGSGVSEASLHRDGVSVFLLLGPFVWTKILQTLGDFRVFRGPLLERGI